MVVELLALFLFISDRSKLGSFDGSLKRPAAGEGESVESLLVATEKEKKEVSVKVSATSRTKKQVKELLEAAKREVDETFPGNNESLDDVIDDPVIQSSYQDGLVSAVWEFDNYEAVELSGRLKLENITEDTMVQASVTLSVDDQSEVYSFSFCVKPPMTTTERGFGYLLESSLREADESGKDTDTYILPNSVGDEKVSWELKENHRAIQLALLGVIVPILLLVAAKEDKKRKQKERLKKMETDYPEIVSMLSLYVGAGISVKSAFSRIAASRIGLDDAENHPGFEGVGMLKRDMEDGKGELEAYRDFGRRMGQKDYRKLSILLSQNLRKGSDQLIDQLEKEEAAAFEERKLRAKIAGEEASTKLLLPMMALLAIVMIVLIFPAMQGMEF